jgi:hypothetical protein
MWPSSVRIDDVELELELVLAQLTIRHGRGSVVDDPTASTCTLVLRDPTRAFTVAGLVGKSLAVDVIDNPELPPGPANRVQARFRGQITDADLSDPDLQVIAAGPVAALRRAGSVSTVGWPAEPWSARVQRFLTAAGVTAFTVNADPGFDPLIEPPPEAEISIGNYLGELAATVGAAVYDSSSGSIVVDAIGARGAPTRVGAIDVDPLNALYSPVWKQALGDVVNSVTVLYGPDRSSSKTVSDSASADLYGGARTEISTTITAEADAQHRAESRLARMSTPRWTMQPVTLVEASPAPYQIGFRVHLTELPPSAPFASWTPVLEGWADRIDGDSFSMELVVSDPLFSGLYARWDEAAPTFLWSDAAPALAWADVLYPDAIGG